MKIPNLSRYAFSMYAASALLAGCGSSQPPVGAANAIPRNAEIKTHAVHYSSWMRPEAKSGDLLYVSSQNGGVFVLSYPKGAFVGELSGFDYPHAPAGLCSDKLGNVFIVDSHAQNIIEYAHGGTNPIATLSDSGNSPNGCALDPKSGDLAVAGGSCPGQCEANIAVYTKAIGSPTVYPDPSDARFTWCTYDAQGNLFTNGAPLTELPKGSGTFTNIYASNILGNGPIQWDGKYLAVGQPHQDTHGPTTIYQVQVSGTTATVVNTIELSSGKTDRNPGSGFVQFWIQGSSVVSPKLPWGHESVGLWRYPVGGNPIGAIASHALEPLGITVSKAPRL
ncbi:MAG TPA: hypothetical protein VMT95_01810 [Candidatus Binatia bacterium]|nr:hypothetical protein [Candidatus Binatia bacterium]